MGYFDSKQYVEFTMHFRCNLKCEHCMIEGTMDWLKPESMERFQEVLSYNHQHRRWKGAIFTGSEITLSPNLPDLARMARQNGFEHVRIQTNGLRLADENYCRELVEAGIDEYFVSVMAADAETHDAIAVVRGAFAKMMRGLENLDAYENVFLLTNTVMTKRSYRDLPRIVDSLAHLGRLVQMDFWNYWPMKETDEKDMIVEYTEILPFLKEAIAKAWQKGLAVEVKNFPECLLKEHSKALNNDQPKLFIDDAFWTEFSRNGFYQCIHREKCGSRQCLGLNTAYIKKFGWQEDILSPLPIQTPFPA
jgi:MoaA/NifB/PqqE/SkfB family radical SAM enzyme